MTDTIQFRIGQRLLPGDDGLLMWVTITQNGNTLVLDGIEPTDAIQMQKEIWHSIKNHTSAKLEFIET